MQTKLLSHANRGLRAAGGAIPLAYLAVGLAAASMLWALLDLTAHSLHAG